MEQKKIFVLRDGEALLGVFTTLEAGCEAASKLPYWQVSGPALPVLKNETFPNEHWPGRWIARNTYNDGVPREHPDGSKNMEFVRDYDIIPLPLFEGAEEFLKKEGV